MKILILTLILMLQLIGFSAAEYSFPESRIKYCFTAIKSEIDNSRWAIKLDQRTIIITSVFKVSKHSRISTRLSYKDDKATEHYVIKLSFERGLSRAEHLKLAQDRAKQATINHYSDRRSNEWRISNDFLNKNPLPRYDIIGRKGERCSVYLSSIDDRIYRVLPLSLYAEAKGVVAIIDGVMGGES